MITITYHILSLLYTPKRENSWDKLGIIGGPSIFLVIYLPIFWGHVLPGCRFFFQARGPAIFSGLEASWENWTPKDY